MNFSNILYFLLLILFGYILHSYIKSYNEIVDELKRIRIKCVINNKENQNDKQKKKKITQLNDNNTNQENNDITNKLNDDDKINIDDKTNNTDNNDEINNIDNNDEINNIENNEETNNIENNDDETNNIENNDDETNNTENNDDETNNTENNGEIKNEIINFTKLSNKNNDSYSSEKNTNIESFENYSKEGNINNWKSYKDNIVSSCEGFQNCPYKGYNVNLYETLINSNTVTKNTYKNTNQLGWEHSDLLNSNEKSHNGWCYLESLNDNKCIPVSKKQNCKGTFFKDKKNCK